MKNNGPVYNMTTGKLDLPLDDHTAIDMQGHISYRVGEHTSISPYPVNNNQVNNWNYGINTKKPGGSSKANLTFWQVIGVLAVFGVSAAMVYYGFVG